MLRGVGWENDWQLRTCTALWRESGGEIKTHGTVAGERRCGCNWLQQATGCNRSREGRRVAPKNTRIFVWHCGKLKRMSTSGNIGALVITMRFLVILYYTSIEETKKATLISRAFDKWRSPWRHLGLATETVEAGVWLCW